jgi:hypothetical protein
MEINLKFDKSSSFKIQIPNKMIEEKINILLVDNHNMTV